MNEHIPYYNDDELKRRFNDLPLPNEDAAWEDMQRRLEKDDEDEPVISLVWKGCAGYVLLLLLLIIVGLFIADPAKWFHGKTEKQTGKRDSIQSKKKDSASKVNSVTELSPNNIDNKIVLSDSTALLKKYIPGSAPADKILIEKKGIFKGRLSRGGSKAEKEYLSPGKQNIKKGHSFKRQNNSLSLRKNHQHIRGNNNNSGNPGKSITGADSVISDRKEEEIRELQPGIVRNNGVTVTSKTLAEPDSVKKKISDTLAVNTKSRREPLPQKKMYFAAGLAVHQLLPVAGQKSTPYNSLGRKSSLADYIPSVYVRMYKDKKWFIQSEFRYGAPQYTKEILFYLKKIDTFGGGLTSANSRLKKTFYHQLPVSFNYFILPGFSIGAGVTFNKFSSALVQQDVRFTDFITQRDSVLSTNLVTQKKADSNFVTSYMQALIEIQYRWKRFSAGARYSFGLQPYLKFKLSDGEERKEKNSSLQLFIRYELWRSGKK